MRQSVFGPDMETQLEIWNLKWKIPVVALVMMVILGKMKSSRR